MLHPYTGSKQRKAIRDWILGLLPNCSRIVEPFAGTAAISRAYPAKSKIVIEKSSLQYNLLRILRDRPEELLQLYMQEKDNFDAESFHRARKDVLITDDPLTKAWLWYATIKCSYNSIGEYWRDPHWNLEKSMSAAKQLRDITILHEDGVKLMDEFDTPDTLFYCDPPYMHATRGRITIYDCEMSNDDHAIMLEEVLKLRGKVCLSGYENKMYNEKLSGWRVHRREVSTMRAKKRTEILWTNY